MQARTREAGQPTAPLRLDRDGSAFVTAVEGDIEALLGWSASDIIGKPSTEFIHPQDQPSAISAWMSMIEAPGRPHRWRGRYRHRDDRWVWVETVNTNRLGDSEYGNVLTIMHGVDRGDLSVEERLRAHEQLLTRLADALPVGILHFDSAQNVIATNDRLDAIVGRAGSATVDDVFATVAAADRDLLVATIESTLDGNDANGVDVRLEDAALSGVVVCRISTRSLTDADGNVRGGIATVDDVTEPVRMQRELERRATTDALTGCLNRGAILDHLDGVLRSLASTPGRVSVYFVDLDEFKRINDTFGHAVGDRILVSVAQRLLGAVRTSDRVGRLGGDEFLVVCVGIDDADADAVARRIAGAANADIPTDEVSVRVRSTIGSATTDRQLDVETLVAEADHAMYRRKPAGTRH